MTRTTAILAALVTTAAAPHAQTPLRVMSFNLRFATAPDGDNAWEKRKDFLAETIATFDPDLLGTQETLAIQRDFLAGKLDGYKPFGAGRDDGQDRGEMAALFYRAARFEKLDGGHFWLSPTPAAAGSKGWDAALPRIATWVKLREIAAPKALPVLFLNTHFDHRGAEARLESARLIRAKLAELGAGCRLVLTGDFNAGEASEPYKALFGELAGKVSPVRDTLRVHRPTRGPEEGTFSAFKAASIRGERIDWIGASPDWDVRFAGIDRTNRDGRTPSDHFPVCAVLRPAADKHTLRILSYNIHHGEGTDGKVDLLRIAKVIRAADADLAAIQEVDDKTKRTGNVDQTAELIRLTGLEGRFGKAIDYQGGGYGQTILSRVPLDELAVHQLPGEPEREQRVAVESRVTLAGQELSFVTTHLHHVSEPFRERQAAKLNELFAKSPRPVILAGDLNAEPASKPLAILKERWLIASTGPGLLSYPSVKPVKQIDYVLARPEAKFRAVSTVVIDESIASDHRPVLTVLQLTP